MSRAKYPPIKSIEATGLPDAWYKLVKICMNEGAEKKRFYGHPVRTYDIVSLTEIKYPLLEPMLHPGFPTKELHCTEYEKQWERDYDWIKQGFEYNYMDRLINYPEAHENIIYETRKYYHKTPAKYEVGGYYIDQLKVIREKIAKRIENGGECLVSNRDRIITWIPDRDLFVNEDQPCLQSIQFFVHKYPGGFKELHGIPYYAEQLKGKAEFHCVWRSRDLYSAWNSNMVGLIRMLMREVFEPNNLELVKVVDFCNSAHIYEADWEAASKVKQVAINPMLMR